MVKVVFACFGVGGCVFLWVCPAGIQPTHRMGPVGADLGPQGT